ncbi:MAG: DUF4426 domain-containing protein [Gammaproteobacteria bacterium]
MTSFKQFLSAWLVAALCVTATGCGPGPANPESAPPAREITRENFEDFGDYVVHFNAQSTSVLPPEVARAYGIQRSSNRAMLNISVLRKAPGSPGEPTAAAVDVDASNLTGQLKDLTLREIKEGEAIYYIGEFPVANRETLIFDISVRPEGVNEPFRVRFRQQFYTD